MGVLKCITHQGMNSQSQMTAKLTKENRNKLKAHYILVVTKTFSFHIAAV